MGRFGEVLSRMKKFEPEGHVVSGRLAEFRLMKLTRAVAGDALVLEGIRIPDSEEGGRREIDMVIATKDEILFVEQKHWSGSFTITSEGRFFQKRNNGGTLMHKNIVAWTARKGDILCDLHETDVISPPLQVERFWYFQTRISSGSLCLMKFLQKRMMNWGSSI